MNATSNNPLKSEFADDPDMKEILAEFVAQLPLQVSRLSEMLSQNNLDDLRRTVHQLKGSGGGYGFSAITEVAARSEQGIKAAAPLETVAAQVQSLIELIRRVEGYEPEKEKCNAAENIGH